MLKNKFNDVPILGLTATTTAIEREELADCLGIKNDVLYF